MRLDAQLLLGTAGFALMLAGTLGYSWRKRPYRSGPGSLQAWLRFHMIAGVLGPALILLHSARAFRGLAGATFWLMLVIVGSGVVGRHFYTGTNPGAERRRTLAGWWLVHVPGAAALFALALVHACAALYYATFQR